MPSLHTIYEAIIHCISSETLTSITSNPVLSFLGSFEKEICYQEYLKFLDDILVELEKSYNCIMWKSLTG